MKFKKGDLVITTKNVKTYNSNCTIEKGIVKKIFRLGSSDDVFWFKDTDDGAFYGDGFELFDADKFIGKQIRFNNSGGFISGGNELGVLYTIKNVVFSLNDINATLCNGSLFRLMSLDSLNYQKYYDLLDCCENYEIY